MNGILILTCMLFTLIKVKPFSYLLYFSFYEISIHLPIFELLEHFIYEYIFPPFLVYF